MVIRKLIRHKSDLELRWIDGHLDLPSRGRQLLVQFLRHDDGSIFRMELPFNLLPLLTPGLVLSRGEVQIARRTGKEFQVVLEDLSQAEEISAQTCNIFDNHYRLGNMGGDQRILRYKADAKEYLIPAVELIRFLFLHNRVLAENLLLPSGLMNLAVVPFPGRYKDVLIEFTDRLARKVISSDFVNEFAWLAIDPGGRRAWDSIRERSLNECFLTLNPPVLQGCLIEFRGIEHEKECLVLEILSISGRLLPAEKISWTHPLVYKNSAGKGLYADDGAQRRKTKGNRLRRNRDYIVDGKVGSKALRNQDVLLLGGKRGSFANNAFIEKLPRSRVIPRQDESGSNSNNRRDHESGGEAATNPKPPIVMPQAVSVGEIAFGHALPPVDFSVLPPAPWTEIGDLGLLNETLGKVEHSHPGMTLTRGLYYLNLGAAFSYCGQRRRTYLMAVFIAQDCHPRVLIDVDHTGGDRLSALLLRYEAPTPLANVADHVNEIMEELVWNYGHWSVLTESRLSELVTIKRLPKLLRMRDRAEDEMYVGRWVRRLNSELRLQQLSLNNDWID